MNWNFIKEPNDIIGFMKILKKWTVEPRWMDGPLNSSLTNMERFFRDDFSHMVTYRAPVIAHSTQGETGIECLLNSHPLTFS